MAALSSTSHIFHTQVAHMRITAVKGLLPKSQRTQASRQLSQFHLVGDGCNDTTVYNNTTCLSVLTQSLCWLNCTHSFLMYLSTFKNIFSILKTVLASWFGKFYLFGWFWIMNQVQTIIFFTSFPSCCSLLPTSLYILLKAGRDIQVIPCCPERLPLR